MLNITNSHYSTWGTDPGNPAPLRDFSNSADTFNTPRSASKPGINRRPIHPQTALRPPQGPSRPEPQPLSAEPEHCRQ
jgi:hypothetical protein